MDAFELCLELSKRAFERGEVPVACVIVKEGDILARSHNMVQELSDPTAHAEILAIKTATNRLGSKFLDGCEVFVSIEPCVMCSYALVLARVSKVTFFALDPKHGGVMSLYNIFDDPHLNHRVRWVYQPREEMAELMKEFFKGLR